jgi:aminopeptidase N
LAEACASTHATENLLNLIAAMKDGRSYPLWDAMLSAAGAVYHIIDTDEATKKNFDSAMRSILAGVWAAIGWDAAKDEDTEIGSLLRPAIIGALSKYGDEAVIKTAAEKFDAFMAAEADARTPALLDPSLRSTVYAIAVKYGGKKEFDTLRDYYRKATDPSEKSWALRSLAYTRTPATISDLLAWCLNSEEVRSQDKVFPIRVVGSSIAGRELAWSFLQKNFDELYKMLGGGFLVQHLVKVPSSFVSLKKANDVEKFYSTVTKASVQRSIQQCLEAIRTAANWRNESIKVVERWTAEFVKSSSAAS